MTVCVTIYPPDTVSIYNASDKVTVLTRQNFSRHVDQSETAWLINFYASWCGHCQSYSKIYRKLAIDMLAWTTVVRVGAINCYAEGSQSFCRENGIRGYPTVRLIPPETIFNNNTKVVEIPTSDVATVEEVVIKGLEAINRTNNRWPRFTPFNSETFEKLYADVPSTVQTIFVIVEKQSDLTGRKVMLDFSRYCERLAIFRMTTDGKLWDKFQLSSSDVPAVFAVLRNQSVQRIHVQQNGSDDADYRHLLNNAIRSYIKDAKLIDNFDFTGLDEINSARILVKNAEEQQTAFRDRTVSDDVLDKNTTYRKVNMIDLELALSHMFREEIPHMKDIRGEAYEALVQWLTVLTKYFPGRQPVMDYFKHLSSKVREQTNGFSGDQFREMVDLKTSNAYLPNYHRQYQHCAGSTPKHRGYPCALWLLFHTLTVSQYQIDSKYINISEVPLAIKNYIQFFFGCRQCSKNFMQETSNITQLDTTNKYEAIVYLWKIHNRVNRRLRGDITEDPQYPKVQFPSKYLCKSCRSTNLRTHYNGYHLQRTIDFLLKYYSKVNIEMSAATKKVNKSELLLARHERFASNQDYKIEAIEQMGSKPHFFGFAQHFSLFVLIGIVIILIVFRHRYCKVKTKRYLV